MNRASEPLSEVSKIDAAFPISIFDAEKLLQVFVFERLRAKIMQKVFNCHCTVEVLVEGQESLADSLIVLAQLRLNFQVQLLYSIRQFSRLSFFMLRILSAHLFDILVLVALVLFIEDVELREEYLTKLVKGHAVGWDTIFDGRNRGDVIKQVQHVEAKLDFILRESDPLHDRRTIDVRCKNVTFPREVHGIEGLFGPAVHMLEVQAKGFLDSLCEVMLALGAPVLRPMAVML